MEPTSMNTTSTPGGRKPCMQGSVAEMGVASRAPLSSTWSRWGHVAFRSSNHRTRKPLNGRTAGLPQTSPTGSTPR
eukprot:scaffold8336_cov63-Phaeocystis_antarctica.AAC.4